MFVKRAAASKGKHFLTRLFGICRLNSVDHLVLTSNFNLLHNFLPRQWWMKRRLSRVTMGPTHKIVTPAHWCTHPAQHTTWTVACHLPWDKISAWRLFYRNLRKADPLPLRLHASIINAVLVVFGLYFPYTTASWGTYPRNICILDELWYLTVVIFLSTHNSAERGRGMAYLLRVQLYPRCISVQYVPCTETERNFRHLLHRKFSFGKTSAAASSENFLTMRAFRFQSNYRHGFVFFVVSSLSLGSWVLNRWAIFIKSLIFFNVIHYRYNVMLGNWSCSTMNTIEIPNKISYPHIER